MTIAPMCRYSCRQKLAVCFPVHFFSFCVQYSIPTRMPKILIRCYVLGRRSHSGKLAVLVHQLNIQKRSLFRKMYEKNIFKYFQRNLHYSDYFNESKRALFRADRFFSFVTFVILNWNSVYCVFWLCCHNSEIYRNFV
jgi:hypothetical protein